MKLLFPPIVPRLKSQGQKKLIYDSVRKKFVALTPEEWVRQHVIHYLIQHHHIPGSLISVEFPMQIEGYVYRADALVHQGVSLQPWMMIECKAPDVPLTEKVTHQILRYQLASPALFMVITNGLQCYCWEKKEHGWAECSLEDALARHKN